jgi:hypothetical protein
MSAFRVLDLPIRADGRGALTVLERELPFAIARAFWITGADSQRRGGHRHHATRLALVAVSGVVTVHMNDGRRRADIVLDAPSRCLLVEPEDWHEMSFGAGAALLVFASQGYDADDYVTTPYD